MKIGSNTITLEIRIAVYHIEIVFLKVYNKLE